VNVRRGDIDDLEAVSGLWLEMVHELAPDYEPRVDWWRGMAEGLFGTGVYRLYVAESLAGRIVGFIDGILYPEPATGLLHAVGQHFYVLPGYRRTSIAGRLYKAAMKAARSEDVDNIEMFCFNRAQTFWSKRGFSSVRSLMRRRVSCSTQ